jgi:predicted metal-dependent phosphoesterase TrpH
MNSTTKTGKPENPLKPLKVDFHIHTAEDPNDRVSYTAMELISMAADEGFDVISITNHECITYHRNLSAHARERGILLIPGVELTLHNRHVLVLNPPPDRRCTGFSSLAGLRRPDSLIIAPHPYFPNPHSLNGYLLKYLKLFDALEYCHFYSPRINFNHRALALSKTHGIPVIGNSDAHFPDQFGTTYSLIHAEKDPESIFNAIRQRRLDVMTRPLTPLHMGVLLCRFLNMKIQTRRVGSRRVPPLRFRKRPYSRLLLP